MIHALYEPLFLYVSFVVHVYESIRRNMNWKDTAISHHYSHHLMIVYYMSSSNLK